MIQQSDDRTKGIFMAIIVICSPKGGCGKTTVAVNLAAVLGNATLLDLDPSQSAVKWIDAAEDRLPIEVRGYLGQKPSGEIVDAAEEYEHVVVDTPPSALSMATTIRSALTVADLAIVPVIPSPIDIREAVTIAGFIAGVNDNRRDAGVEALQARLLVNRVRARTIFAAQIGEALEGVGLEVLKTMLSEREAHKHAALDGVAVHQVRGGKKAAKEVDKLAKEVRRSIR